MFYLFQGKKQIFLIFVNYLENVVFILEMHAMFSEFSVTKSIMTF